MQELTVRGGGTPLPLDPPRRLVSSGPYAYLANPMQLSAALLTLSASALLGVGWLALGFPLTVAYHAYARWDEERDLVGRFGSPWKIYRQSVRSWIPRFRPWHPSLADPDAPVATLYVADGCRRCSTLGHWLAGRQPLGLRLVPAEEHPDRDLERLTYDPGDGTPESVGVAALARACQHLNLAWAALGWLASLPGIGWFLQVVADGVGGEARPIRRRTA